MFYVNGDIAQLGERTTEVQRKNQIVRSLVRSRVAPIFFSFFCLSLLSPCRCVNYFTGMYSNISCSIACSCFVPVQSMHVQTLFMSSLPNQQKSPLIPNFRSLCCCHRLPPLLHLQNVRREARPGFFDCCPVVLHSSLAVLLMAMIL